MAFGFENVLGIHEQALFLQGHRAEILAANLANADTPGFKARDIDFRAVLTGAAADPTSSGPLELTQAGHIQPSGFMFGAELLYRQPIQASLDGNTVEPQMEMAAYTDNAVRYMTTLRIVNGRINTLLSAIRGE